MSTRSKSKTDEEERKKFATTLVKYRSFRGHESAYGFYHGLGGQENFQFTYNHYLMIESGQRLPSVDAFKKILQALFRVGMTAMAPERRELSRAYLKALSEGDSVFDIVWNEQENTPSSTTEEEMLKETARTKVSQVPRLSQTQAKLVFSSPIAFWCHQWLLQTGRTLKSEALALAINANADDVLNALKELTESGVVEKTRGGKYRSKFWETDVFIPAPNFADVESPWLSREIDEVRKKRPKGSTGGNHGYFFLTLESEKEFELLTEHFRETMRKAYLYRKKGPHKGKGVFCSAEWRFFRLFQIESED